jgi:hypothetical protein
VRTLIHTTLVILGLQGGPALAGLQAQAAPAQDRSANRACALLTDQEIDAATGLDYGAAEPVADPGPSGTASCVWGGASFAPGASRPQLGVMLTQMLPSAVNALFPSAPAPAGCTRETLGDVGDKAYLERCERSRGLKANVKVGRNRLMLQLDPERGKPLESAKPALVALAKAAALRAKGAG